MVFLKEDWYANGGNETTFRSIVKEVSNKTHVRIVDPAQLTICSVAKVTGDGLKVMMLKPDFIDSDTLFPLDGRIKTYFHEKENYRLFKYEAFRNLGLTNDLIDEIKSVGYFLRYKTAEGSIFLIPSEYFMATLCRQLGVSKLPEIGDPFREIFIAFLLRDAENFKIMYRQEGAIAKCFACFTPNYTDEPQCDSYSKFIDTVKLIYPNARVSLYQITHFKTFLKMDFDIQCELVVNGKTKRITPCVTFTTSDVGDSSFIIQSGLSVNGRVINIGNKIARAHKGIVDIPEMVESYAIKEYAFLEKTCSKINRLNDIKDDFALDATIEKVLTGIHFKKASGSKASSSYVASIEKKEAKLPEVLWEILNIPGNIELFHWNKTKELYGIGKKMSPSSVEKVEDLIGEVFNNPVAKEIFSW